VTPSARKEQRFDGGSMTAPSWMEQSVDGALLRLVLSSDAIGADAG
jgi:hypothetical protein